ncbi:MAG: diaminopimelate epimerase [Candidatus Fermentibacteraceae bacterium]
MSFEFTKMSGAGNDFIVLDSTDNPGSRGPSRDFIAGVCRRGLGVGADGLLELLPPMGGEAFRMSYFNSDGGRASMCGNGARCICTFAFSRGLVKMGEPFDFTSDSGLHHGLVLTPDSARIWMTEPTVSFLGKSLGPGMSWPVSLVDTGVPHAVVLRERLDDGTFEKMAPVLRRHTGTGPAGANANWAMVLPDGSLSLRTFERGVEGETLACGTGAVAAVLVCLETLPGFTLPASVRVASGLSLTVGRDGRGWWLSGEARAVYRGVLLPENEPEA